MNLHTQELELQNDKIIQQYKGIMKIHINGANSRMGHNLPCNPFTAMKIDSHVESTSKMTTKGLLVSNLCYQKTSICFARKR